MPTADEQATGTTAAAESPGAEEAPATPKRARPPKKAASAATPTKRAKPAAAKRTRRAVVATPAEPDDGIPATRGGDLVVVESPTKARTI
ncbi:MAG TPA: hypothetical protein VM070_04745, partial [Candidatus Saccharimonadales bacterium]|nr:hypothetical protein [Candidatus Saccharimonadales bacterium]